MLSSTMMPKNLTSLFWTTFLRQITGRADFARASEVDPQCVLIFEADLRNPLIRQKIKQT